MFRIWVSCLFFITHFVSLFSLEKSCVFEGVTQSSIFIESEKTDPKIAIKSYSLKNIANKKITFFPSVNNDRENEKKRILDEMIQKDNLWQWWNQHHMTIEKNGIHSSLIGSTLSIPLREVPTHGLSVNEFFLNKHWQFIDHKQNLVYLAFDNKSLAGYEDIADEPFLALRTKTTDLEKNFDFSQSSYNFAHLNLFPKEFDCSEPEEKEWKWIDDQLELYPNENLTFYADGTVHQTIQLNKRLQLPGEMHIVSGFPIQQIINHSDSQIMVANHDIIEPQQCYEISEDLLSLNLMVTSLAGELEIISQTTEMMKWKLGLNKLDLGIEKNPTIIELRLNYDLKTDYSQDALVSINNKDHHFDHITPSFELKYQNERPEKIWWQISNEKEFTFLIPNFQGIQEYTENVHIDAITNTFFNPLEPYYFRIRDYHDGKWSAWSLPFEFTVNKPQQVKAPVFKKLGEGQYQISWDPSPEKDTRYLIFASNAFDFMPSIYTREVYQRIDRDDLVSEEIENLIATTSDCSIQIGTEYAFYRIIAEKNGEFSIPSPIVRVYDYGLSIPRSVLQASEIYHAERMAFPPAYPHLPKEYSLRMQGDILGLQKLYYVQPPHVDDYVWNYLAPLFLPENHPIKPKLDRLFSKRVTQTSETLRKAGFTQPNPMRFSKTVVSRNKNIPGFMFKLFCDDQEEISDWQKCLFRVTGALHIQHALDRYSLNHLFVVPTKWIYPLPVEPSPPQNLERKNFIVVENTLDIYTGKENNKMWKGPIINPVTLTWIYILLNELGLADSPYNHNMPVTKDNRIAFVDTEHHHKWPVPFFKLWQFLSPDMQDYWNRMCEKGGP